VDHPGILIIPQPPRLSVAQSDREIASLLIHQPVMVNVLFVWTTSAGWIRPG